MTRLSFMLFGIIILSSLGLVNSHHQARKLYIALEQLNKDEKLFEQEYGQLQLEQSTWAIDSRVEMIAASRLQMQVPTQSRIQVVAINPPKVIPRPKVNSQPVVSDANIISEKGAQ